MDLPMTVDTVTEGRNMFWYKAKVVLGLMGHNSLVVGKKVHLGGMRVGLEFNNR